MDMPNLVTAALPQCVRMNHNCIHLVRYAGNHMRLVSSQHVGCIRKACGHLIAFQ